MELTLTLPSGEAVIIGIRPDGEPEPVQNAYFQPMTVTLVPDCEETDYSRCGDCYRPTRKREAAQNGVYGKLRGEEVWLCGEHGRQAAKRGEVIPL